MSSKDIPSGAMRRQHAAAGHFCQHDEPAWLWFTLSPFLVPVSHRNPPWSMGAVEGRGSTGRSLGHMFCDSLGSYGHAWVQSQTGHYHCTIAHCCAHRILWWMDQIPSSLWWETSVLTLCPAVGWSLATRAQELLFTWLVRIPRRHRFTLESYPSVLSLVLELSRFQTTS